MLLAIDCGNTNTIFSIWDGTKFVSTWRTATDHQRTADQYFVWLSTLMSLQNIKANITDVIISSTVPRVVFNLRVLSDRYFDTRPIVVGKAECQIPIEVRVEAGTAVGPDRIVNSVAGYNLFGGNLIISLFFFSWDIMIEAPFLLASSIYKFPLVLFPEKAKKINFFFILVIFLNNSQQMLQI